VPSDGSYGIPKGLICSFPIHSDGQGAYKIVQGLPIDPFIQQKINATVKELEDEKAVVRDLLG
jgi:malate dehydrogenase